MGAGGWGGGSGEIAGGDGEGAGWGGASGVTGGAGAGGVADVCVVESKCVTGVAFLSSILRGFAAGAIACVGTGALSAEAARADGLTSDAVLSDVADFASDGLDDEHPENNKPHNVSRRTEL
jgi:hypothetical protein